MGGEERGGGEEGGGEGGGRVHTIVQPKLLMQYMLLKCGGEGSPFAVLVQFGYDQSRSLLS